MKARHARVRLKRTSLPSIPLGPGGFGPDGLNVHMFCEDVRLFVMPSARKGNGLLVRLDPQEQLTEDKLVTGFSEANAHDGLTEAVSDWAGSAAHEIMRQGVAAYELGRLVEGEGDEERVVGFRLVSLEPSEIVTSASGVTQRTVRRDDSGRPLGDEREERVIPLEFSVVCKLPRELEQARGKAISALQALDSTRTTELMLEGMNGGGPPIDFAEVRRSEIEAVAEATRRFGWNARNVQQYNGYHLTYRQLQFERFLCELRSVLTESAQEIVSKGCGMLGVEASLVIEGLPTLEDIARAQHELAEGKRSFGDIMESVRGG